MAHEDASATADHSAVVQTETSPASEKPVETTHEANSDGLITANATLENVGISKALSGDSNAGRKRSSSPLDNREEALRSPKRARIANEPELGSNAEEVPLTPSTGALAILETNLRSTALSTPTEPSEVNHISDTSHKNDVLHSTNCHSQEDEGSSGLSSPISYSNGDTFLSSESNHAQGRTNGDSEAGTATPPSSMDSAIESVDKYTMMKTFGRTRKQTEHFGDLVATVTVIQDDATAESEVAVQQVEKPGEASLTVHQQASTTRKKAKQPQSLGNAIKAEKARWDDQRRTEEFENKFLSKVTKTPASRKKTEIAVKNRTKPKPKLSKAQEKAGLRKLGEASPLGRWVLQNSTVAHKEKHLPLMVAFPVLEIDETLLSLSGKMTKRESLENKLGTEGKPEVWADRRQQLCETLAYFKKPQGGCYSNDGHVYGFLFDAIGHCREYMDENVIICRAGGSMERTSSGSMVQRKDHSMDEAQVKSVLNDMAHHNPTVVICGDRNVAARCKMPHKYCVLGWYKPTLVWSEKTVGKGGKVWTTIKYRLERLNSHLPAWHASKEPLLFEEERASIGEVPTEVCDYCHAEFPQVYLGGWMCLNGKCIRFWKFRGVVDAPYGNEKSLSYHPAFLMQKSELWGEDQGKEVEPAPLRPLLPDVGNTIGDNLTYINTRGICCPECGKCNSRRLFKGWICENPECDFELSTIHRPVSPAMLHTPWDAAQTLVRNNRNPTVSLRVEHKFGFKLSIYTFHGISGSFIHASATKPVLREENGPDDMLANFQTVDMGLERRVFTIKKKSADSKTASAGNVGVEQASPAAADEDDDVELDDDDGADVDSAPVERKSKLVEGDLMRAFSMNYGMPYKFVASGGSKSFEDGPWPVTEARRRLNWAVKAFLGKPEEDMDLNEELIFAYLEKQELGYHDDGEEGLGPRIATLSLGGKAKMHMRMKTKHYAGCSKQGIFVEEKPVPGSLQYGKRLQVWKELQRLKATDSAAYNRRRKEIPKELGLYEKRLRKAEDLVTVTLSHGDIVIMDGYDIQKYLEHMVASEGYLRFALTCRTVLENHLKPEERPSYEVKVDEQTYEGPKI